jgi:hypothetical protein
VFYYFIRFLVGVYSPDSIFIGWVKLVGLNWLGQIGWAKLVGPNWLGQTGWAKLVGPNWLAQIGLAQIGWAKYYRILHPLDLLLSFQNPL